MAEFTHFNAAGRARMVDVSEKPKTNRTATAQGRVLMRPETLEKIRRGNIAKGDVLAVAQTAGIMGAKRTPDLVPEKQPLDEIRLSLNQPRSGETTLATGVSPWTENC